MTYASQKIYRGFLDCSRNKARDTYPSLNYHQARRIQLRLPCNTTIAIEAPLKFALRVASKTPSVDFIVYSIAQSSIQTRAKTRRLAF